MDNVLRSYCGTQYRYDERGNLQERIENGKTGKFTWDLYDRLRRYEDDRLIVEFGYDALGRRVYKDSRSKYRNRVQAGPVWNENARRALDEKLGCDLTLLIWDGDTLAFEQRGREGKGRTTHYVFEPGTFVPVAQGVMNHIEEMLHQPRYEFPYDIDRDPVWQHKPTPKPFDTFGWYQCDQLGTPMEATAVSGQILWKGNYKAWGCTVEQITIDPPEHEYNIRFQGHYFDAETSLHYNRYRYYAPTIGRFIGIDPISLSGGLNVYQYAPNTTAWVDPYGLSSCPCNPCSKYDVGLYSDLKSRSMPGDKLDIHHAMQAHPASQAIPNYNYVSAPEIAVPRAEHIRIPTQKGIYTGSVRQLLAKDIRDLRAHTGAPNECLQNLIRLNKETYPASLAK